MPVKSHPPTVKKRRNPVTEIYQHNVIDASMTDDVSLPESPPKSLKLSLNNVLAEFKSLDKTNWRVYSESNFVHFTYYENLDMHGIASASLLISENDDGEVSFSVAKNGLFCQELLNHINVENWNLEEILNLLLKFRSCIGNDVVIKKDGWLHMPFKVMEGSSALYVIGM